MPLVDHQIDRLATTHDLIAPYTTEQLNPASYDVLVGSNALIETADGWKELDLTDYTAKKPYWLEPRDFVLLELVEYIKLPNNLVAQFALKSSRARDGYNHSLAGYVDNGYQGRLTLEVENLRKYASLPLYQGLKIGQLIFTECAYPERPYSVTGRYFRDQFVQPSKG